ncbi:MAG: hypothetical protein DWQ31_15105 [Planctomycetota bacterium]|nr:MAG: hypothetical protein DWQ31_15105 [Planctomycetota bacterium]REJ88293.1 MAG: hypothetical protein DWQ35_20160 [Planctomycetota bacterium]REK22940.1 MAG: hypothetical protein DWQ42_16070 [Planctomycetota bacterium]REK44743.1 MAG: hypothetical protein DWQ46_08485 [Planctomycetota bacterium]
MKRGFRDAGVAFFSLLVFSLASGVFADDAGTAPATTAPATAEPAADGAASEGAAAAAQQDADQDKNKKSRRAEPRGRLPNYYGRVVDEEQRETIYAIQRRYKDELAAFEAQIRELRKKMNELRSQRADEVAAVLTAEQLAEVNRLREASRQRRAQSRSAEPSRASEDSR